MCEARHIRNDSFIFHTQSLNSAPAQPIAVATEAFPGDAHLDTAVSAALLRQVARGEVAPTIRLHRTGPILAFGKLDRLRPGFRRAVEIARAAGYEPVERIGGGRAAVFHTGTVSFSHAVRAAGGSGSYPGTRQRFESMAATIAAALAAIGVDGRVGEVAGEYCPGEFSVNARSAVKLAGIGQRVIVGGAHVGAVIVVRGAAPVNAVLEPVYEALDLAWDPAATGSVATELGDADAPLPAATPDPLVDEVIAAIRAELARSAALTDGALDPSTLAIARASRTDYLPRI